MVGKIKILGCDIQRGIERSFFFDMLEHEGRFAYTARSGQSDRAGIPVDAVVYVTVKTGIRFQKQLLISVP